jgi:hypothetical protein
MGVISLSRYDGAMPAHSLALFLFSLRQDFVDQFS